MGRGDTWVPRRNLGVFEDESFDPEYNTTESVEFYAVPYSGRALVMTSHDDDFVRDFATRVVILANGALV